MYLIQAIPGPQGLPTNAEQGSSELDVECLKYEDKSQVSLCWIRSLDRMVQCGKRIAPWCLFLHNVCALMSCSPPLITKTPYLATQVDWK
jgi:hypothetical protein